MRKVISTVFIEKTGEKKPIYEVHNERVDTKKLIQGQKYLIEYRLLNSIVSDFGIYLDATEGHRTLVFTHPTNGFGTVGIPTMNIINLIEVE